jgi:hypothetical protein
MIGKSAEILAKNLNRADELGDVEIDGILTLTWMFLLGRKGMRLFNFLRTGTMLL